MRFSLPAVADDDSSSSIYSNQETMSRSGHLVDMQSKMTIDVPEEIWTPGHRKTRSVQSVIMDTVTSYDRFRESQVPNLSHRNHELYLAPESPLNKYKIPVPLQIQLPPYLAPENRHKKSNSLVYDGNGYSEFVEEEQPSSSDTAVSSTENSIPSAVHDIYVDVSSINDTDKFLGIDDDANVNLKMQNRNIRRNSPERVEPSNVANYTSSTPTRTTNQIPSFNTPTKINTPTNKIIDIPDLDNPRNSYTPNGSLKFFDQFEQEHPIQLPHSTDTLNLQFQFPKLPQRNIQEDHTNDDDIQGVKYDFVKIPNSDDHLDSRRAKLKEKSTHCHRRSRSIHQIDDLMEPRVHATSTPPKIDVHKGNNLQQSLDSIEDSLVHNMKSLNLEEDEPSLEIIEERVLPNRPAMMATKNLKPLSSFSSFGDIQSVPLRYKNITEETLPPISPTNSSSSPRRQLSNVGSQTSSEFSGNSQFSQNTYQTAVSSEVAPIRQPLGKPINQSPTIKSKFPIRRAPVEHKTPLAGSNKRDLGNFPSSRNNGLPRYKTSRELFDGKIVDVIHLDDTPEEVVPSDLAHKTYSLDPGDLSIRTSQPGNRRKTLSMTNTSIPSKRASTNEYEKILRLCDATAVDARETIYELLEKQTLHEK